MEGFYLFDCLVRASVATLDGQAESFSVFDLEDVAIRKFYLGKGVTYLVRFCAFAQIINCISIFWWVWSCSTLGALRLLITTIWTFRTRALLLSEVIGLDTIHLILSKFQSKKVALGYVPNQS